MKLLLAVSIIAFLPSYCAPQKEQLISNKREDISSFFGVLQSGDIIFRYGNGLWSRQFRNMSLRDKRFSHVGIVVIDSGQSYVVHASADDRHGHGQVERELVSCFLADAADFALYRVRGDVASGLQIACNALTYIGTSFDVCFSLDTDTEVYCSELVRICVNSAAGSEIIGTSMVEGIHIVAIDDCYNHASIINVYDSEYALHSSSIPSEICTSLN